MLHNPATCFIQVIENALDRAYLYHDKTTWERVYGFYEARYLNPNSPYKNSLNNGYHRIRVNPLISP